MNLRSLQSSDHKILLPKYRPGWIMEEMSQNTISRIPRTGWFAKKFLTTRNLRKMLVNFLKMSWISTIEFVTAVDDWILRNVSNGESSTWTSLRIRSILHLLCLIESFQIKAFLTFMFVIYVGLHYQRTVFHRSLIPTDFKYQQPFLFSNNWIRSKFYSFRLTGFVNVLWSCRQNPLVISLESKESVLPSTTNNYD